MKKLIKIMTISVIVALMMFVAVAATACGSSAELDDIKVELPVREYEEGQTLNVEGMTVTAMYMDGTEKAVADYKIKIGKTEWTSDYKLKKTDTRITVEYTENEVTKSKNVAITVNVAWSLTIKNATINGKDTLALKRDEKLPADPEIVVDDGEELLGWQDEEGNYYGNYEALAEAFSMPNRDSEILAVTSASFTQPFTPACSYKHLSSYSEPDENGIRTIQYDNGSQKNGAFEHVQTEAGYWATRYVMDTKQDIGILNGPDEEHKNDGVHSDLMNDCPYSDEVEKVIMMNFTNNSEEAITILYGVECFGIRGEVTVTLDPGETESALLKQLYAPDGKSGDVAFHVLCILDGGESGYDLTIWGFLAE